MTSQSGAPAWLALRAQILDNLRYICPMGAHASVVIAQDPATGMSRVMAFNTVCNTNKVITAMTTTGPNTLEAMQNLFLDTAKATYHHMAARGLPVAPSKMPTADGPSPFNGPEDSSDDSDWEELDLKGQKAASTNRLLNKYKAGHKRPQPASPRPVAPPPAAPPPAAPHPLQHQQHQQQQQQQQQQSAPPPPPPPRLPPPGAVPVPASAPASQPPHPPPPPPPPHPFHARPRVPPLIPPPLPVRLAITAHGASPCNVLTTLTRPSLSQLLSAAIEYVEDTEDDAEDDERPSRGLVARARRARIDNVMCDVAGYGTDDLRVFFGKGAVPFFEVEVWRREKRDDDDDDDEIMD